MGQYTYVAAEKGIAGLAEWDTGFVYGSTLGDVRYDATTFDAPVIMTPNIDTDISWYGRWAEIPLTETDFKVVARVATAGSSASRALGLGFLTQNNHTNGYGVYEARPSPQEFRAGNFTNGSIIDTSSYFPVSATNWDQLFWIRLELVMPPTKTFRMKAWNGSRVDEPVGWDHEEIVAINYSQGGLGLVTRRANSLGSFFAISELYVGTGGDQPPEGGPGPGPGPVNNPALSTFFGNWMSRM